MFHRGGGGAAARNGWHGPETANTVHAFRPFPALRLGGGQHRRGDCAARYQNQGSLRRDFVVCIQRVVFQAVILLFCSVSWY